MHVARHNRIKNATIEAVAYWNNLTSMKDVNINVGSQDGVPTAEELPLVNAETLGIDYAGVVASKPTATTGVYSINGTLVRKSNSVDGLPKGSYVVVGKKVVVK